MVFKSIGKESGLSLRKIVLAVVGAAFVMFILVYFLAFYGNISGILEEAEREHLNKLSSVVRSALHSTLHNIHSNTRAWSSRDETYLYALGENEDFIARNLADASVADIYGIDFIIIKDKSGNDLFLGTGSEAAGRRRSKFPAGLSEYIRPLADNVMQNQRNGKDGPARVEPYSDTGFISYKNVSYIICIMPIYMSDEDGEPAGTFSFLAAYGDKQFKALTGLDDAYFTVNEQDPEHPVTGEVFEAISMRKVRMMSELPNYSNGRSAVMTINSDRNLYNNAWSVFRTTALMLFPMLLAVLFMPFVIIDRFILRPLQKLTSDVSDLDKNVLIDETYYSRHAELHTLARAINDTLNHLDKSNQAEERSKVSINVLTSILNGLDAYLYVSDPITDEILFINDKMCEHFGIDGEGVGYVCWRVLQKDFTQRCMFCPCNELEKNPGKPVVWEELNTITGRYYRNTDTLIDWMGGNKVHLQHSVDITDIKIAEFALQRRLEQQALMTSLSQNFLLTGELDAQIDHSLAMTGEFESVESVVLGRYNHDTRVITCTNEWHDSALRKKSRKGESFVIDEEHSHIIEGMKDNSISLLNSDEDGGSFIPSELNVRNYLIVPVYSGDDLWGMLGICGRKEESDWTQSDISLAKLVASILSGVLRRHDMEKQLHRLSSIVEGAPHFIFYTNSNGEIAYTNPAAADTTGYTNDELRDGGLRLIFDSETLAGIHNEYIPSTFKNGVFNTEVTLTRKDGKRLIMETTSFTMGKTTRYIGVIAKDVTELRELEAELIAAKDLAENSSRSKSEFLSRMSHEMRTPMNAIIGMTNIAKASGDIEKKEYCLDKIGNASTHLLGVINDILDMSKIEANKFELNYDEFVFSQMVTNAINFIGFRMDEKSQSLTLFIDPDIPERVVGDEQRLNQVITNLLTNAVKFTPNKGQIKLSATIFGEDGDGIELKIDVADSGIGISKEQQERLFNLFEQADGSIARRFGGTGLGLAISKRIIELMGGNLSVDSELGVGSCFSITVKVKKAPSAVAGQENLDANAEPKYDFTGKTALIAEDVDINREIIFAVIDGTGLDIDVAENGREAVEIFGANPDKYDIILMDIHMPEVDGLEASRRIRGMDFESAKRVPIIAMTADVFKEDVETCFAAGMNDHIGKPIDFSEMLSKIHKYTC